MIEWLWPWMALCLPLPLLIRALLKTREQQQGALTVPSLEAFNEVSELSNTQRIHGAWRAPLLWLAWALLVTATARPQWTGEPVTLPTTGRDLMLAVDISGSMATEDLEVNGTYVDRLSVVKAVVGQFVEARQGDRIGLVLFGTNAYLQAPLTFDVKSVNRLLTEAPVGIAGGKTAVGDAIGLAVKRLRKRPQQDKVIILLTDGANNVGEVEPKKAAELAAFDKIKIYTIGVGADELRMPSLFGSLGRITNPSADLDEETLQAVADTTNGRYFRAKDTQKLLEIYDLIDELEPIDQDPETYRPIQALYYWPFSAAVLFFSLILLIDLRLRRGN
ncbi:MAG: Ca-activated chloride channel family protein [Limisphaerales bacterium]|jgi:Ca-activated chloride channel family protein